MTVLIYMNQKKLFIQLNTSLLVLFCMQNNYCIFGSSGKLFKIQINNEPRIIKLILKMGCVPASQAEVDQFNIVTEFPCLLGHTVSTPECTGGRLLVYISSRLHIGQVIDICISTPIYSRLHSWLVIDIRVCLLQTTQRTGY